MIKYNKNTKGLVTHILSKPPIGGAMEQYMIKTDITLPVKYNTADIKAEIEKKLPISASELSDIVILRRALDASDKSDIRYKMSVGISLSPDREAGLLKMKKKVSEAPELALHTPKSTLKCKPLVVGSGPSGLFAALILAESGACPIVIERGLPVDERKKKAELFSTLGILDPECNIQFGEGGAGTYSDGKLKVGALDKYKMKVLREFADAGANGEILYSTSAHVGTDVLSTVIKGIREKIIRLGGAFIFGACLKSISTENGEVRSAVYEKGGEECRIYTDKIILATGHSARDIFYMLEKMGVPMQAKGFGVGVRIEHPREYINKLVYGEHADDGLETASYHLVTHLPSGRSVYSFCMCPGGTVVSAASEQGGIVTNGMSEFLRDGENSNAALLVSVTPKDFGSDSPLAGIEFQRNIERAAYGISSSYSAPVITLKDLMSVGECKSLGRVRPTYPTGTVLARPEEYMPEYIAASISQAMPDFDAWLKGYFYGDAVLTGPETRTTSPVRILRDGSFNAFSLSGLYPIGEGAGYAGGIVSSAVDGIKCALSIILSEQS